MPGTGTRPRRGGEHPAVNGASWPLVGRAEQLAEMSALLVDGRGPGVLLTGEAGVGKSRLAAEVLDRCARDGVHVVRTSGAEASSGMPFQAMAGLVSGEPTADLFARAARDLRRASGDRPVVLAVDEADHLDPVSAALVHHLAATARTTLLAAARTDALEKPAVRALRRRPLVREVEVRGLGRDGVGELLQVALGGPVDGVTTERLWRLSRGNPLFLRHLVTAGRQAGALRAGAGVWRWHGRLHGYGRLSDLVASALGELPAGEARALEWIAHVEPVPLEVLERLAGQDELEELERRSLISLESRGDRLLVRTAHPLYGEAVRSGTSAPRRRAVYREFADALARSDTAGEQRLPLVNWRLLAGEPVADADVLAAASDALARRDPELAERLARTVPAGRALVAESLVVQGRAEEAEARLAALDRPALRALNLFWGLRRTREAADVVRAARSRTGGARRNPGQSRAAPDTEAAELAVAELALATFGDGDAECGELPALPPGSAVAGAAAQLRAYLTTFLGRPASVVAAVDSGELPLLGPWPAMDGAVQACHLHALVLDGRIGTALGTAREYYLAAVERGAGDETALLSLAWGVCETWAGRHEAALPHYREARALIDAHTPFPVQAYVFSEYAAGLAATGDTGAGRHVLAEGLRRLPGGSAMREHLALGRVRVLACSGRLEQAAGEAVELSARYLTRGRLANAVEALYYAARVRPSADAAARLAEVVPACGSALFPLLARHARAFADGDAEALGEVSEALALIGYHGIAAEAASAASAHSAGRNAVRYAFREARLRERCGGFRARWAVRTTRTEPLTRRQREVCELAVRGLDNAAIAEELSLSGRTVANHLQSVYGKLGVRSRTELAAVLDG